MATVSTPTLTPIQTVVYTPFADGDGAAGSSQVTLTASTGTIATGVTEISFHLSPYSTSADPGYTGEIGVVREFDVTGAATVAPEPATLGLLALATFPLITRRNRRGLSR